jgi:hypothetical protein
METQDVLKLGIGTKEMMTLKPAKVKIVSVEIKKKTKDDKEMKIPLVLIKCKHPDKDELVDFTKVKVEKSGKLEVVTTWLQTDEEDGKVKIQKNSAIARLMKHCNTETLEGLYNKEVDTIEQSSEDHYLCIKAY